MSIHSKHQAQNDEVPNIENGSAEAAYSDIVLTSTPPGVDSIDSSLRPKKLKDYIGQEKIKENIRIVLEAAKQRNEPPEHILFYGPPGLGKTTLAHIIAHEVGAELKSTSGAAIERVGDLASILTNLNAGDILFIDEIHRLNKSIEEVLYPALESRKLDIILGKGPSARTIQLDLNPFTLIAATTRVSQLSAPLRSRFSGGVFRLDFYTHEDMRTIVGRSAKLLETDVHPEGINVIAARSRFTPRTANYLVKRVRDYGQVYKKPLSKEVVDQALELIGVDEHGLLHADRDLLRVLIDNFRGGPVGIGALASALSEESETLEEFNEPYLLQIGMIERTPRGRTATLKAQAHMEKHRGSDTK